MARFQYSAILSSGQRVAGTLRGRDRREALERLLARGYHPLTLEIVENTVRGLKDLRRWFLERISLTHLAVFTRQLGTLLKAGLPIVKALATVRKQTQSKPFIKIIEEVEETISADGVSLAEALGQHPRTFKPLYRGLVRAGEEGGNLAETLNHLADYLGSSAKLRGQILGAFVYPSFIVFLGCSAVFVLMTFVIPRFQELFLTFGNRLPLPTKILLAVSGFMANWWWLVLGGFVAAILGGVLISRTSAVRLVIHSGLLRAPVLGAMILKLEICRISRTLSELLHGGIRILDALDITGQTARNLVVKNTLPSIIRSVATGDTLANSFERSKVYPPLMVNLIRTGEETGRLEEMLLELAGVYEDEAERAVTTATKLIEPVLIVVVGGVVAGIVAAVMLPIFEANTLIR